MLLSKRKEVQEVKCERCGYDVKISEDKKFCPRCGKRVSLSIPNHYKEIETKIWGYIKERDIYCKQELLSALRRQIMEIHKKEICDKANTYSLTNKRFDVLATDEMIDEYYDLAMKVLIPLSCYIQDIRLQKK